MGVFLINKAQMPSSAAIYIYIYIYKRARWDLVSSMLDPLISRPTKSCSSFVLKHFKKSESPLLLDFFRAWVVLALRRHWPVPARY